MARGKGLQPVSASVKYLHLSVEEMPWPEIERAAGKRFHDDERKEIYECTVRYSWERSRFDGAATAKAIQTLRKELLCHSEAICRIADETIPRKGEVASEKSERIKAADAMRLLYHNKDFSFLDDLHRAATAASRLVSCLESEPSVDVETTRQTAEVAGLSAFLLSVLDYAVEARARGNHPNAWRDGGFEYHRWGIAIGPRCAQFPEFVSAVLEREVTADQLRGSWPERAGLFEKLLDE